MLKKEEVELIEYMDYQVLNNGMDGWISNNGCRYVFGFIELLNKRNSELDQKVIEIFIKATTAAIDWYRYEEHQFIPEYKDIYVEAEKDIEESGKAYQQVAKQFMNSYGLEDYLTKFHKNIKS